MFEHSFKNIDNLLRKDKGLSTEIDYVEQTSWLLFLKYLSEQNLKTFPTIKIKIKLFDSKPEIVKNIIL